MASEYKKRGGGYTTDKETGQTESQKHLSEWGDEEWQTKEGSGKAKQADGTEKRYLPKKTWEHMTEEEKEATEKKKEEGSKEGKQFVENTEVAKEARKNAQNENRQSEGHAHAGNDKNGKQDAHKNGDDESAHEKGNDRADPKKGDHKIDDKNGDEDLEEVSGNATAGPEEEEEEDDGGEDDDADGDAEAKAGQKRSRLTKSSAASKKQKSTNEQAEKGNGPPARPGSIDRLPKKGQKVSWHSLSGYIHGTVMEVATEEKEVEGKKVKGAEGDARIVLESDNGKVAVHKPEAVFFDD